MQAVLYAGKHNKGRMRFLIPWHSGPPVALAFFAALPYDPSPQIFLLSSAQILEYFLVHSLPLPTFPPELFMQVRPINTMKAKHFQKGVDQLAQEGAIQVYRNE